MSYKRHRFPREVIAHAMWLYFRFPLSFRLIEEMSLEPEIWLGSCPHLGSQGCQPRDIWHLDEVRIVIQD
ncbi:hypothetical protein ANI02nite_35140 [Acetobacter nitrogenifigens DSM 23921 = NBRC 105050]|uniref:Transposase n=1 Tax=Acetobacter nitrogenifigens DSM 23921 = NBRC 105050 TaxID=1120919 RepID=A0A511XF95_9PROT|nr:hypothetical protein ANI02nite_35140 [Acetobacter nitrogenifigens DSM 23921 = NBRC 105050]